MTEFINNLEKKVKKKVKKTVFVKLLGGRDMSVSNTGLGPHQWEYVKLIHRDEDFDIMVGYDNPDRIEEGQVYLGHWNMGC